MGGFLVRLVGYALLLGVAYRAAQEMWSRYGLDAIAALQPFHDVGVMALFAAPLALALIGFGRLRSIAVFTGAFLAGAALTAPWVCARVAGA